MLKIVYLRGSSISYRSTCHSMGRASPRWAVRRQNIKLTPPTAPVWNHTLQVQVGVRRLILFLPPDCGCETFFHSFRGGSWVLLESTSKLNLQPYLRGRACVSVRATRTCNGWLTLSLGKRLVSKLNAFVWWLLLHPFPRWGKGCCLATADYRHLPPFGQERPAVCVWSWAIAVFDLSYCSASSPGRVKGAVLATAEHRRLPPVGLERPATLGMFWIELLRCVFQAVLLQRLFPLRAIASIVASDRLHRVSFDCAITVLLPLLGRKQLS